MKIIEQSHELLPDSHDLVTQLGRRARICYQSEPKDDETGFVQGIIKKGHNSCLEMGVLHLQMENLRNPEMIALYRSKFLTYDVSDFRDHYVTGSVRAWREWLMTYGKYGSFGHMVHDLLVSVYPVLFNDIKMPKPILANRDTKIYLIEQRYIPEEMEEQHTYQAVKLITNRAMTHELVRHRVSSVLQECVSGDTLVLSYKNRKAGSGKSWKVRELFNWKSDPKRKGRLKLIRLRGVDANGCIIPVKIKDIYRTGVHPVFIVTTRSGRQIKCTDTHRFLTEGGWKQLLDIRVGDCLKVNGIEALNNHEYLHQRYLVDNIERKQLALEIGVSDSTLGKYLAKLGLQKHKSMYPGRKAGHGVPGMHSLDERKAISKRMTKENNHKWLPIENLTIGGGRSRAERYLKHPGECCLCGSKDSQEAHHIDKNPKNNEEWNILYLCTACHKAQHFTQTTTVFNDPITTITKCELQEETFDIEIDHPCHNYIADGFVVHNSQRYVRYDKPGGIEFIKPIWLDASEKYDLATQLWLDHMQDSEDRYRRMLESELQPQQARGVLPNDTKTEIIIYASLSEWRHIFYQRTQGGADPAMKSLMIPVLQEFKELYPSIFDVLKPSVAGE